MTTKRPSQRNTKSEILSAFDNLLSQKKDLERQLKSANQAATAPPIHPERNGYAPVVTIEAPTQPTPLNAQSIEAIIDGLSQLQSGFGGAVSDLSEKLVQEATQLEQIQATVTKEAEQLTTLHNLEFADTSLEELLQQYEENAKTFDTELAERQETVDQEITQAQKAWTKEQEEYYRTAEERNENQVKTQRRDTEEYNYVLTRDRKLSDETYAQQQQRLYQELEELRQIQAKQWAEREKAIAEQETEFTELKTKVEVQPEERKAAIKRAKEEGKGIANAQAKVKADLAAKEVQGQTRAYDLQIQSLQENIQTQDARLQTLSKQLDAALKQVQDLAVKAIEGASNASSFQAVKEIAIEQAKTQTKNK
ncbi:MAG: hypothetical protein F6K30_15645 [Cyanothece sp. SIO2G6]|nr:hypothetical protein [Cyanothece sp. SIO2G6]